MIFDLIYNDLKSYDKIIVYGAGDNGRFIARYLCSHKIQVDVFADADPKKHGKKIDGIRCLSDEEIIGEKGTCLIVTPLNGNEEIIKKFKEKGFERVYSWNEIKLFVSYDDKYIEKYFHDNRSELVLLESNIKFKDKFLGKRCFVLGTGPSLKKQNLKLLENEVIFTVNQFMRLDQFKYIHTDFHVWNDSAYFDFNKDEEQLQEKVDLIKLVGKHAVSFFPYNKAYHFVRDNKLNEELCVNYYHEDVKVPLEKEYLDPTSLMPEVGTAVLSAVNIAFYMGFSEIYLLGCDCTDILTVIAAKNEEIASVHYAYDENESVKNQVKNMLTNRPLEIIYGLQRTKFMAFRRLKEICDESAVKIYNCTEGGLLEGIPRKKFESLFDEEKC